ncbi:hypothetical protein PHMEG_0006461 [Phytophthora megakarya]|uniref:DDE Tnp4 domain-containing protein n=1 Tax=Phytophthora megakarya TaxID=4795 RepID=A0A225WNZ0_9STRA|nr:hypothetical protein PHMEG_0006461 [Phytophthora megakarya]
MARSQWRQLALAPVWLQLALGLDRLGTNGNGVSTGCTKFIWGVGRGTLDIYTVRVVIALNDLSDTYVVWPDEEGRRRISRRMIVEGFPGCVGFIDGTTFPLSQKPAIDGECYFDQKYRYSLNAQVVCDGRRRIISFLCGWLGSCADSTVYRAMMLAQDELKPFFFGHEPWASLRELRAQLNKRGDMERVLRWITACVVFHNIMVDGGEDWPEEHEVDNSLPISETGVDDDTFPFRR